MHEVVANVWRNGFLESVHHGVVVGITGDGHEAVSVGAIDDPIFPRSSNKPLQAVAMLRAGLELDDELLALACASHSGEDFHLAGVRRILEGAGLDETALQCTSALPIGESAMPAYLAAGGEPSRITMNCSGKHAAMLATCVENGWDISTYLDPQHPLQRHITTTIEDLIGERVAAIGVDGCGAPLVGFSTRALAASFGSIATSCSGTPESRVATAMNRFPEYVGGTGRDVTRLMAAIPDAVAKDGAEGVLAIGLPDGSAVAVKIADGSGRARTLVACAALARLGVPQTPGVDSAELAELSEAPVLGHGEPVGTIRPTEGLAG